MLLTSGTILVIEDSEVYQMNISETLKSEGYDVVIRSDGYSALKDIQTINPDLILLDVVMPGINGYDVCKELKQGSNMIDIPVIFLTSLDSNVNELLGFELGAVDYIRKPITPAVLKARVHTHIKLQQNTKELHSKNNELKKLNEDLNTFSYTLTHDLKTPININLMIGKFILEKFERMNDHEGIRDAQSIIQNCDRMNELILDILQLTRISHQEIETTKFNLSEMVQHVFNEIKLNTKEHSCELNCMPNQYVNADMSMLRIAITNLINNAWKYSSKKEEAKIEFGVKYRKGLKTFYIKDNGVGFNVHKAKNMFTPFTRYHSNDDFPGTGVGLATVKKVFDAHLGEIWIESALNKGTTVYFSFVEESTAP